MRASFDSRQLVEQCTFRNQVMATSNSPFPSSNQQQSHKYPRRTCKNTSSSLCLAACELLSRSRCHHSRRRVLGSFHLSTPSCSLRIGPIQFLHVAMKQLNSLLRLTIAGCPSASLSTHSPAVVASSRPSKSSTKASYDQRFLTRD